MAINFPNSPSDGDTHTAVGKTFTYDATAGLWNPSDLPKVPSSDAPPSNPATGDLWFDSSTGTLYFYYNDGSSSQWVGVSGADGADGADGATGATGATGPNGSINILTDVDTNTSAPSTGDLLEWNGTNWVPTTGQRNFAHFANTATYSVSGSSTSTGTLVPFDTVMYSSGITHNFTNNTWTHDKTGYYNLRYGVRQQTDLWTTMWINSSTNGSVGLSHRTGAGGGDSITLEAIYEVTSTSEVFSCYHWTAGSFTVAAWSVYNPPSSISPTVQAGTAPSANSYYNTIIISEV